MICTLWHFANYQAQDVTIFISKKEITTNVIIFEGHHATLLTHGKRNDTCKDGGLPKIAIHGSVWLGLKTKVNYHKKRWQSMLTGFGFRAPSPSFLLASMSYFKAYPSPPPPPNNNNRQGKNEKQYFFPIHFIIRISLPFSISSCTSLNHFMEDGLTVNFFISRALGLPDLGPIFSPIPNAKLYLFSQFRPQVFPIWLLKKNWKSGEKNDNFENNDTWNPNSDCMLDTWYTIKGNKYMDKQNMSCFFSQF